MATKYVTLKDSNGDTLYPQAVATNLVNFTGATSSTDGASGIVPAPVTGEQNKTLHGDGSWDYVKPLDLKGYSTANTTDTWVPVTTSNAEIQHRVIAPFNADGTVPNSAIDWSSTTRPIYYKGTDWATTWTFKYNRTYPQLIFVAWASSVAMFCRIYDIIYKVFQSGSNTVTASVNTTNLQWTITTNNTGIITVLEMRNTKTS